MKLKKKINHTKGSKRRKNNKKQKEKKKEDANPLGLICPIHWLGHEIEIIY
jgi:hypothetical protein